MAAAADSHSVLLDGGMLQLQTTVRTVPRRTDPRCALKLLALRDTSHPPPLSDCWTRRAGDVATRYVAFDPIGSPDKAVARDAADGWRYAS
jgi:hypothetical protein